MSHNEVNSPLGEQVVKVRPRDVRALGLMPRDVEVIGSIVAEAHSPWVPEPERYVYLHIKSTVSFSRPDRAPLCIEDLFEFYQRYIDLRRDWATQLEQELAFFSQTGQVPRHAL
jgi:hypothetical protein